MSLPPGFLDELKTRASLAQVAGRKVAWDLRKSNQGKGDLWAPCPFHQEKTASFHVDDRKGFFYCFGCHAKGDVVSFVQETENVSFIEAVEILAREAGMTMPARDPKAAERAEARSGLAEVMEAALRHYRLQLGTAAGAEARDYLARRGLGDKPLARWEIGFAPPGWQNLRDHLKAKGIGDDMMIAAGLTRASDKGREPYDVFRNRIMFPIRDARGRAIAFGGRAMDPGDNAKYLNSPETALFDKGRSLYNHGPAREAAGRGATLVVAEGYMDVIALAEAGFEATVAPLGTAVTEDQLRLLWRIADEPVIALDGDKAGLRAAMRVVDLALPMLEAGKSLRFALMPEGLDPDDLIRAEGPGAMQKRLDAALPMVRLLWRRETEGRSFDSPERKAALDRALRDAIRRIADPSLRRHYADEIANLRAELFRGAAPKGAPGRAPWRRMSAPVATPETRASLLAAGAPVAQALHEAAVLATLLNRPELVPRFVADLERMETSRDAHETVRQVLLAHAPAPRAELERLCGTSALEKLFEPRHVRISPGVRSDVSPDVAELAVTEELAKLAAERGRKREVEEAMGDVEGAADEGLTWRLGQAAEAAERAARGVRDDRTEYDIGPNGVRMRREERSEFDALLDRLGLEKGDSG